MKKSKKIKEMIKLPSGSVRKFSVPKGWINFADEQPIKSKRLYVMCLDQEDSIWVGIASFLTDEQQWIISLSKNNETLTSDVQVYYWMYLPEIPEVVSEASS